jgi:hypothetical protein
LRSVLCLRRAVLFAQEPGWQLSPDYTQVPLWSGNAPDAQAVGPEVATTRVKDHLVAGRPWVYVGKVSPPTMTVTRQREGIRALRWSCFLARVLDSGHRSRRHGGLWLTSKGITRVLLKYGVPGDGLYPKSGPYPDSPMALEDTQRTVGLVRFQAAEWHIDSHRVGMPGFSADGHLVAAMSTHFERRLYPVCGGSLSWASVPAPK